VSEPTAQRGAALLELVAVMARLRGPGGCPWDAEQTHQSLAPHLLEETYELLDAIDLRDDDAMRDELGDVLLQVVFHAQLAADEGRWDIDDVARGLVEKLVRRHPHVFADTEVAGADEVLRNWERLKAEHEGRRSGVDEDIPDALPALMRAAKVQRRAAAWGFEPGDREAGVTTLRAAVERLASEPSAAALGDVLFTAVVVARADGTDAEGALRSRTRTFAEGFDPARD
jgi:XTP/dITP diphosphohydrolase